MKKSNLLIIICVIAICAVGWFTFGSQLFKEKSMYSDYVEQAEECFERGLYERAIVNYNLAYSEKKSEEIYTKIYEAYELRYEEDSEDTEEDYVSFLALATAAYPGNKDFVDRYVEFCITDSDFEEIYICLTNAIANGYDTDDVRANLKKAKYACSLRRSEFYGMKKACGEYFAVLDSEGWNVYNTSSGFLFTKTYEYVGSANADGMVVVTGEDSRLLDATGMTYGIFEDKVTDAGVYSDGLVAVCIDGVYSYYNDYSDKQFGEYEMAGTFQNGKAAVKEDGKWMLVDKKGKSESDDFDEIVLDETGNYLIGELILAKEDGEYGIYNEKLKRQCKLDCSDTDILTKDGIIAVEKNGKWGFTDTEGKMIIEPEYEEAKSFSNGLAAVKKDGKWGFIDIDGTVVIDFEYLDAGYMDENGLCPVRIETEAEKLQNEEGNSDKENITEEESSSLVEETSVSEEILQVEELLSVKDTSSDKDSSESEDTEESEEIREVWKFLELELGITEAKK